MRISTKQKVLGLAAASVVAAGAVFIPAAVEDDSGRAGAKAPPELPDVPTDPAEGVPVPIPGHGG